MPELYSPNDSQTLRDVIDGYVTAMLWAEHDESDEQGGDPLEDNYYASDLSPETIDKVREVCSRFVELTAELDYRRAISPSDGSSDAECAGHDLWLTSRGHGTGFWDSGRWELWSDAEDDYVPVEGKDSPLCKACYDAAGRYVESPYIGDDGLIYL